MKSTYSSFWQVFRLIFVIFSLYLLGDAFYRWDGFRYHSTFLEFLPSIALAFILWSLLAALTALLVWLLFVIVERLLKIESTYLLMGSSVFLISVATVWVSKKLFWPDAFKSFQSIAKILVFSAVVSIFLTWLSRHKSKRWMSVVQDRLTPLVWFFGLLVIVAVPLVIYQNWFKESDKVILRKVSSVSAINKERPNIILVTFDALAARNMSVYGYERPTTPFIAEWAKSASLFTRLYADDNHTTPAVASLMTGKRVWTHKAYQQGSKPVKGSTENLPLILKNNGYTTMAFVLNVKFASPEILGMSDSFDISPPVAELVAPRYLLEKVDIMLYRIFGEKIKLYDWLLKSDFILNKILRKISRDFSVTVVPPKKAFNKFLEVLDSNSSEPFFAWIHIFPPHDPYLPPEPFRGYFESSTKLRTFQSQEKFRIASYKYLFARQPYPQEMQPTVDLLRSYYDEFVRYCDKQFEDFINNLEERGILESTLLILSSDHGESFEHGYFTHQGPYLYEQVTHIPLIIKKPYQDGAQIINDVVEQIDIPPTILDLADIPVPAWMEGRSLRPLLYNKKLPSRPVFSMNFQNTPGMGHQIEKGTLAVWEGNYKLIHYLEKGNSLLFNLKQDPGELNNLFDEEAEIGSHLLTLIKDSLKKINERIGNGG